MSGQELVPSRRCRHVDWRTIPDTPIEFCTRCGFALTFASSDRPSRDSYAKVQVQPAPGATFDVTPNSPRGARSYQYIPLDLQHGRQIRVLVLKSGLGTEPLRCEIEHVNLQQGPIYEAVSYTWGDENGDDSICRSIQCVSDSRVLGISKNCENALRHLRKRDDDRRLWVDAICIDQSNVSERNHQVKNMLAIYRNATRVLVFLGKGHPVLDRLMDYMVNDCAGQLPCIKDFIRLFQSRWFHRVWVLQEVAVAKSVVVVYGTKQMTWEELMVQSNLFLRLMASRNLPLVLPPVVSFGLLQTTTGGRRLQDKADLLALLQISRNCSCKDARDKVYAILGLLHNERMLPLQPDYAPSVTPGWVFLQAAAWHLFTTKSFDILSLVDGPSLLQMPSWVPDWTKKSPTSLPAQFEISQNVSTPHLLSATYQPLQLHLPLDYPLNCLLLAVARKCGPIWTSETIFETSRKMIESQGNHPKSEAGSTIRHWFLNPPQNKGYRKCDQRVRFWERVHLLDCTSSDYSIADTKSPAYDMDVPPAFGGPCQNCFMRNDFYHNSHLMGGGKALNMRPVCCCKERHFDESALDNFFVKASQYGSNRALFGTKYSLGIGPSDLRDTDEVWIIEGTKLPFILRPVVGHSEQYKLLGPCYLHGVERSKDRCFSCELEFRRGSEFDYDASDSDTRLPYPGNRRGLPDHIFEQLAEECFDYKPSRGSLRVLEIM